MKVVLLKEVKNLGHAGDIKEVNDGYARNFLIPQGLADMLTKHTLGMLEARKRKQEKMRKLRVRSKKLDAKRVANKTFIIQARADDKGTLYAKLDAKAVADELQKQGFVAEAKEIILDKAIKKVGEYKVRLNLGGERINITINIINQDDKKQNN